MYAYACFLFKVSEQVLSQTAMQGQGVLYSVRRRWKSTACALIFLASLLLLAFNVLLQLGEYTACV